MLFLAAVSKPFRGAESLLRIRMLRNFVVGLFGLLLLGGCVAAPSIKPGMSAALPQQMHDGVERRWWAARFRIYWPQEVAPDWAADHLLAHAVVAPVLGKHATSLPLWRFHRRAARDTAGHQFSFIFYTDATTAQAVLAELEQQPAAQALLKAGFVTKYYEHSRGYPHPDQVQATSDPNWSPSMQRNWPVYVMGVSALWLGLLDEQAQPKPLVNDAAVLLRHYREAGERLNAQWRAEGLHALFHHLSASFGYVPLPLGDQEVRF